LLSLDWIYGLRRSAGGRLARSQQPGQLAKVSSGLLLLLARSIASRLAAPPFAHRAADRMAASGCEQREMGGGAQKGCPLQTPLAGCLF